jgi:hypothetical protein
MRTTDTPKKALNDLADGQQLVETVDRLSTYARLADIVKSLILSIFLIVVLIVGCIFLLPEAILSMQNARLSDINLGLVSFKILDKSIAQLGSPNITVSGAAMTVVDKGSPQFLGEVKSKLLRDSSSTIDALKIVQGKQYNMGVMANYISTLGIKFILFEDPTQSGGKFDGWIEAGSFVAQLDIPRPYINSPGYESSRLYNYAFLRSTLVGIKKTAVKAGTKASDVLKLMEANHTDNVAVLSNDGDFQFMANRGELLSKVVSIALLKVNE